MKIASNMNLDHLAERIGKTATTADAEKARKVLVEKFDDMDTTDISDAEFSEAINEALSSEQKINFTFDTAFADLPENFDLEDLNIQIERVGHYGYPGYDYNGHGRYSSYFIMNVVIDGVKHGVSVSSALYDYGKLSGELRLDLECGQTSMFVQKFENPDENEDDLSCVLELIEAEIVDLLQDEFNKAWEDFDELAKN